MWLGEHIPIWDIPDIGLAILTTEDMSGEEQNGFDLNGLPILLIPAFEGEELYCNIDDDVFGDIGCFVGDLFCKLNDGDPTELDELEFFGDIA